MSRVLRADEGAPSPADGAGEARAVHDAADGRGGAGVTAGEDAHESAVAGMAAIDAEGARAGAGAGAGASASASTGPGPGATETADDSPGADAPPPFIAAQPRISVVVPTYRRPALLTRCLQALFAQRMPAGSFEIVVVDDERSAVTAQLVDDLARTLPPRLLRYVKPEHGRGPAVARNCGWRAARAPLVAFTDDDTVPDLDWLREGERAMQRSGCDALGGRVIVPLARAPGDDPAPTDHELMTQGLERAEFVTANAFVRRRAMARVGGFDERFARAWREDSDLQFRLEALAATDEGAGGGGGVGRCETAVVLHPARAEPWGISLRQQKNVFFDALLYRQHPALYRQRILRSPPWDYFAIVALTIAALALGWNGVLGSAAVALGIAVMLVLRFAWRRLRVTSHAPAHVFEMLATSAVIPFLSVYWRLRGAWHFRVPYL